MQLTPPRITLASLFDTQVAKIPHVIALIANDASLSYAALDQKAEKRASELREHYQAGALIPVCKARSIDFFVEILAILKIGCAYVPIDPKTPEKRVEFILEEIKAAQNHPELAYVIYTSGTTGHPKGVMITHDNVISYVNNVARYFDKLTTVDFSTSIAFDLSVTTTLVPLLLGKTVAIFTGELTDMDDYIAHLNYHAVDFIKSTPAYLSQVFSLPQSTRIKTCFVGGEKLLPAQLTCLLRHCDAVYDEYGPTENTVGTTLIQKSKAFPQDGYIGKPYAGHEILILKGELYIGGVGLSPGYLNRPELTARAFVTLQSSRWYKTGDLVKALPDGNLVYIGRVDFQIKRNGYRIECAEIEMRLAQIESITQAVVFLKENHLVAYYLSDKKIEEATLLSELKLFLPEYMLPSLFVHRTDFPLTLNGKVDRQFLQDLPLVFQQKKYLVPQTDLEKKVCAVWESVLDIERISILDDFFSLGGDSIQCLQVMALLLQENIDCRVKDMYTHRTIQALCLHLKKNRVITAEQGELSGEFELLPIQSWFFDQEFPIENHYNQSFLAKVPSLSLKRLNEILPLLIAHHDALRISFVKKEDGTWKQRHNAAMSPVLPVMIEEVSYHDIDTAFTTWQSHFDIEKGPLWKIVYISGYPDNTARLYFAFHHLIIDTLSWRILLDDIQSLYEGKTLPNKSSSYRQWVKEIKEYPYKFSTEQHFWLESVKHSNDLLDDILLEKSAYKTHFSLSKENTSALLGLANKIYDTDINDLLLTALGLALQQCFSQSTYSILLEGHGREEINETLDISRTIGWFTSLIPITLSVSPTIARSILSVKAYLRSIPNKGIGCGAFDCLKNLPQIRFNYLGQFNTANHDWMMTEGFVGNCVHAHNERPYVLDIIGNVIHSQLSFNLSGYLKKEVCEKISILFQEKLEAVMEHCLSLLSDYEAIYPANSLQQGFIYHALSQPKSDAYHVQFLLDYTCAIEIDKYQKAWEYAIFQHPILRTSFYIDDHILQRVSKTGELRFNFYDLSTYKNINEKTEKLEKIQKKDRQMPFDFSEPTLMRLSLIKCSPSHFVLLKNSHHSILDGWSLSPLINSVHRYYKDLLNDQTIALTQDNTYIQAQKYLIQNKANADHYWRSVLEDENLCNDITPLLESPIIPKAVKKPGKSVLIEKTQFVSLKSCAQALGVTIQVFVQFAWHKLIQCYTGDDKTIVGATVSGRGIPISGIDQSVGLYINTLPILIDWTTQETLKTHLEAFSRQLALLNQHSFSDLSSLSKNGTPLFQTLVIADYETTFETVDNLSFQSRGTQEVLDYPLALIVREQADTIRFTLKYDAHTLSSQKAEKLLTQLQHILHQMPSQLFKTHDALSILSEQDTQEIIYRWNDTKTDYPAEKHLHTLFDSQAKKTPDAIALVSGHQTMTYQALNDAANALSDLISHTRTKNIIPVCLSLSFETVITLLAILKSGAAYAAMDPDMPEQRLKDILQALRETKAHDPDLAYVIYTSGTTGTPKGVMISHQNVVNYLFSITQNAAYQRGSIVDCSTSMAVDATVAVLWAPLITGKTVVLCDMATKRDVTQYLLHLQHHQIDLLRLTPSFLSAILQTQDHRVLKHAFSRIRCLILGGEKANITDIRTWMQLTTECAVINHYGPTETTVAIGIFTLKDSAHANALSSVPIGKASHNHQFYILDQRLCPVPIGAIGELYVGGQGVALGYLNQPDLTEQSFIPNPFGKGKLYKTGDFVKYRSDRSLEFCGRRDAQIKLRGFRIELQEIETHLKNYPGIQQVAVLFNDKTEAITAYYVSDHTIDTALLKNTLKQVLSVYMIPAFFVSMKAFPLTKNGKLDIQALNGNKQEEEKEKKVYFKDELENSIYHPWKELLKHEEIGLEDDFFMLGGHSILAVYLAHRLSEQTHKNVSVTDIFKYRTISALAAFIRGIANSFLQPILRHSHATAPLSFAQAQLWFMTQLQENKGEYEETEPYHISFVLDLDKTLDREKFKQAIQTIIKKHEILRTTLDNNNHQVVHDSPLAVVEKKISLQDFDLHRKDFFKLHFDLERDYPIRVCFFNVDNTENNKTFVMFVFHHIAFDAWSKKIFFKELMSYYYAPDSFSPLSLQYKDFSHWQSTYVAAHLDNLVRYWKETLDDYTPLDFLTDHPRPSKMKGAGNTLRFSLPTSVSRNLKKYAESQGVTLYTLLLTGFALTLQKYTGQEDFVIGTAAANRQHPQLAALIGFFVNILPLRIQLRPEDTLRDLLKKVQHTVIDGQSHQALPFSTLVEKLSLERDAARHPLFQVMFNVEYADIDENSLWRLCDYDDYQSSKLDFGVSLQDSADGIKATLHYAVCLFNVDTMTRFFSHYEKVLTDFLNYLDQPISAYCILHHDEYTKMTVDWNKTDKNTPKEAFIHTLFEAQVVKYPHKIAVVDDKISLSYEMLNQKANQLARAIIDNYQHSIPADTLIAVYLNRSVDMIVALLAILKSGAAYVPIEIDTPIERMRFILEDTRSPLLLTHQALLPTLQSLSDKTQLLCVDRLNYTHYATHNLSVLRNADDLAYVIYTSGTTGTPKGVMIPHKGLVNIVSHLPSLLPITHNSRVLHFASLAFDAATLQCFNALTIGAQLFIASAAAKKEPDVLTDFLQKHAITFAGLPPALLVNLNPEDFPALETLVVAGEAAQEAVVKKWSISKRVMNAYGPTENSIGTSVHHYHSGELHTNIGKPIPNVKVYVLGNDQLPVPIGAPGELYIGGAGLARGYLNQPQLTEERFIQQALFGRLYKTGDRVKWLSTGELVYLGRNDDQVKIRGFRVELSEIEKVLLRYPGLTYCCVVVKNAVLAAYYVSTDTIAASALKNHVTLFLPYYMIPEVFISLEKLPLTVNGKIDKKALPEAVAGVTYAAPRTALETLLCTLWEELLCLPKVGIFESFFTLGGHSILAMQLSHRISQATHKKFSIADIFQYNTIASLAAFLETRESLESIQKVKEENIPLSFAQERLWFIEQYENGSNAYHIVNFFKLAKNTDVQRLKNALQNIVARHEILRTVFVSNHHGVYSQVVLSEKLHIHEAQLSEKQFYTERPFDLTKEYPLRVCFFDHKTLLIVFHHVAIDVLSKEIFLKELNYFYHQDEKLPPLSIQYRDFSQWQRNLIEKKGEHLKHYWLNKLKNYQTLNFRTDYPRPAMMDYRGDIVSLTLSQRLLNALKIVAYQHEISLFTLLLTGLSITLAKYTGQHDFVIGTPVINRQHPQLKDLIGLFLNSVCLRINYDPSFDLKKMLNECHRTVLEAQAHQDLPFEQLISLLAIQRDTSRHPLFQLMFTHYESTPIETDFLVQIEEENALKNDKKAKFDMAISIDHEKIVLQYATALFKKDNMENFLQCFETILTQLSDNKSETLSSYTLLNKKSYQDSVVLWNAPKSFYPKEKTLIDLFQTQANQLPDKIALVFGDKTLTYKALDDKSTQFAHLIQGHSGKLIALCLDRSLEMIIGLLAILKVGAAYVPMDPDYPKERNDFIIQDIGCDLILTHQKYTSLFSDKVRCVALDTLDYSNNPIDFCPIKSTLAYVMYTSGTTGKPKGVMISHQSVMCLLHSLLCDGIDQYDQGTLWTNITFDVSVYEIFSMLTKGGTLHILPEEIRLDETYLFEYIVKNAITTCYLPPFFVSSLSSALKNISSPVALRNVLLGVEPILASSVSGFIEKNIRVINAYGPTETTVSSTAYLVNADDVLSEKMLPIGKPLNNETVYILDEYHHPVPKGVIGELYIGGDGLSEGYWNNEALTKEKFIITAFSPRLYKTGDLGYFDGQGNITYAGRSDFQVKINGFRVELSEIEEALLKYEAIEQCIVVYREKNLIAYYVGVEANDASMRDFLAQLLPLHMIPAVFIRLNDIPMTANGKLNREALPIPELSQTVSEKMLPRNPLEEKIAEIWKALLTISVISITDDFFALGGDSITCLQLISTLRYDNIHCTVKDIFQYRTIAALSEKITQNTQNEAIISSEQGLLEGTFDLLPIQRWFFAQSFKYPNYWNQAFLLKTPPLSFEKLALAFNVVVEKHDMLRAQFICQAEKWQQRYQKTLSTLSLHHVSFSTESDVTALFNTLQNSLDIENGPLWHVAYINGYPDGTARLFFVAHHLIVDIVSWRILRDDLKKAYEGHALTSKTSSYRQWQQALQTYAKTHAEESVFWETETEVNPIFPEKKPHSTAVLRLDKTCSENLFTKANLAYHTKTEDLLLTALAYALQKTFEIKSVSVTLESHGREPIDDSLDVSGTLGWFTTLYPCKLPIYDTLETTLIGIKDKIRALPQKGIGFGALSQQPLPPIYFNYQGFSKIESDHDWAFTQESTGVSIPTDNIYDFLILINASIIEGALHIHFGFQCAESYKTTFLTLFERELYAIQQHCFTQIEKHSLQYTAGDFQSVETETHLKQLPLTHNPALHHHSFDMTHIQKAYALGRLSQFEIGNVANHVYIEFSYPTLHVEKLENALNTLIETYDELRTVFDSDHLTQRYLPFTSEMRQTIAIEKFNACYDSSLLQSIREKRSHFVYQIDTYPLFHLSVSRFEDCDVLHVNMDLLLLDAQARMSFFAALTTLYQQDNTILKKPSITFRDYQVYMGLLKHSPWYAMHRAYWQKKISNMPLRPKLLLAANPNDIDQPIFKISKRSLEKNIWEKFKVQAESYHVSYSSVLLALYGFVLSRFAESPDFLITMTVFNRYAIHPEVNQLWGDFTSTNLFAFSKREGAALDFFKMTHNHLWEDISHALYTGLEVQRDLMNLHQLDPKMAVSPIVFTCVVRDNKIQTPAKKSATYFIDPHEKTEQRFWIGQTSQAWIDLQATERDGCFSSGWLYVSQLFPEGFIDFLNDTYCDLITYLATHSWEKALPSLSLPTREMDVIHAINRTEVKEIKDHAHTTLVDLCLNQARKTPEKTAVIDHLGQYTYQWLDQKSEALSFALLPSLQDSPLIAVLCEKSVYQALAALSIMRLGKAYLPLNVEWPIGRIENILREGKVSDIVVSEAQWQQLQTSSLIDHYAIHRMEILSERMSDDHKQISLSSEMPAYVIFTSGSTGKPKGVCISHEGAVNTILAVNKAFSVNAKDSVLALSELSFDLSVYDIFGVLVAGGTVVFPDQQQSKNPLHWASLIHHHGITLWNTVPQLMQLLWDTTQNLASLRVILLSGDWVPPALVTQLKSLPSSPRITSLGGATEASIWSIWYHLEGMDIQGAIPYGVPMPNQTIYILNTAGEHCPMGLPGEIHIGGDGLALAYWESPEKTAERFIFHPHLGRLYKTGDLGQWHAAGYVEFLGRIDNQVKRNGNRVELDEIAITLQQLKGIDNALVRMDQDRLIAYVISSAFKAKKMPKNAIKTGLNTFLSFEESLFNDHDYRAYKTYRQFSSDNIPMHIPLLPVTTAKNTQENTLFSLGALLSALRAKKLPDKIQLKYLYPSAGSCYAIHCYVTIPEQGCYYYDPQEHALKEDDHYPISDTLCLCFEADQDSIQTHYGKDWARMAHIELGHMVALLTAYLDNHNIGYAIELSTTDNDADLLRLVLNTHQKTTLTPTLEKNILTENDFSVEQYSVLIQTSETGQILKQAKALVLFEGNDTAENWFYAGYEAQKAINYWQTLDQKIAYASLGLRPTHHTLYALAIGMMRVEDLATAESHAQDVNFSEILAKNISKTLPCYMVPQYFIPLEKLPLSANGKIDFQALPLPDMADNKNTYVPPTTALEKIISEVWEEILNIRNISITDDFFRLGGDSITTIHVATKLRQKGIECDVLSIFEHRRIDRLAQHVQWRVEKETPSEAVTMSGALLEKLALTMGLEAEP